MSKVNPPAGGQNSKLFMFIAATVILMGIAGFYGLKTARADEASQYPPVMQKLVERFNLNEDEVKAVFDDFRVERQAEMKARFEERLNQAVSDGQISEEQKQLIIAKHEELRAERNAKRDELKTWAEENGIDLQLFFGPKGGRGKHPGCWQK